MTGSDKVIAQGKYIGSTTVEMTSRTGADRVPDGVNQKALFERRGDITLYDDRLVLSGWSEGEDVLLRPDDIRSAEAKFTDLYGQFIGGRLNAGKPLVVDGPKTGEIYLLIDRKEFLETTDDRRWAKLLTDWADTAG